MCPGGFAGHSLPRIRVGSLPVPNCSQLFPTGVPMCVITHILCPHGTGGCFSLYGGAFHSDSGAVLRNSKISRVGCQESVHATAKANPHPRRVAAVRITEGLSPQILKLSALQASQTAMLASRARSSAAPPASDAWQTSQPPATRHCVARRTHEAVPSFDGSFSHSDAFTSSSLPSPSPL